MPTPARVVILPQEDAPLTVEQVQLADPGPLQVAVRLFSSGICHSQLHLIHNPRASDLVLGHEATGEVIAIGSEVTHVAEGDIVFVTWLPRNPSVGTRPAQKVIVERPNGRQATSRDVFTWADHTVVDDKYVVKVPPNTRRDVTSIVGCAVLTGSGAVYNTAGVREGDSVAVFGAGGVGLSAVVAASVVKADPIIAVDLDDEKLEFARKFGATHCINASAGDAVEQVRALTADPGGLTTPIGEAVAGVDFAFDCIGREATMGQILRAVRPGHLGHAQRRHRGTRRRAADGAAPLDRRHARHALRRTTLPRLSRRLLPARARLPDVPRLGRRRRARPRRDGHRAVQDRPDQRGRHRARTRRDLRPRHPRV